jgi:hypothetical protein
MRRQWVWRVVKLWPNPYDDTRDRSTLWIVFGVFAFILLAATRALVLLHFSLR